MRLVELVSGYADRVYPRGWLLCITSQLYQLVYKLITCNCVISKQNGEMQQQATCFEKIFP